jgi:flavin reductase (DIM6/NTAB) family NADH-FMN oxidoreductase RutF
MTSIDTDTQKEQTGKALGRIASGVFVITTQAGGQRHGLLATWIGQASFQPPLLTVAFNKERGILKTIKEGSAITINVLSKQNTDLFKAFVRPAKEGDDDRFAGLELRENAAFGPIFEKAVSYLNCRIMKFVDAGDHQVVIVEVLNGGMLDAGSEPMVHLRNNGFQY